MGVVGLSNLGRWASKQGFIEPHSQIELELNLGVEIGLSHTSERTG